MAAPTFQAAGAHVADDSGGTIQVNWPAHQADDIALLIIESSAEGTQTLSDPQGFAAVPGSPIAIGTTTTGTQLSVFWCRATSGAMTGPTLADAAGDNHRNAQIVTFRGCVATGDPWDVIETDSLGAADTAVSIPGDTTTVPDTIVAAIVAHGIDSAAAQVSAFANADLTGVAERTDVGAVDGHGGGFAVATGVRATAGAYGATTATLASASVQARMSIALRPPVSSFTVAGSVTIGGAAAPDGEDVQIFADNGDGTWDLVDTVQTTGGTGGFTASVPDNTRDYFARYDDGTNRGVSALDTPV